MITFVVGDLTRQRVDAIVNAANEALAPGGGVCGAIRRAGGDEIFEECARLGGCDGRCESDEGRPATGSVRHPRRRPGVARGRRARELLASAYRRALEVAEELGCRTIAFPALSTGIYGYPVELAAPVAVGAVRELADRFDEIRFVFLDDASRRPFATALEEVG